MEKSDKIEHLPIEDMEIVLEISNDPPRGINIVGCGSDGITEAVKNIHRTDKNIVVIDSLPMDYSKTDDIPNFGKFSGVKCWLKNLANN